MRGYQRTVSEDGLVIVGRGPWAVGRGPWAVGRGPAGDAALARHTVAGRHLTIEYWQDAIDQRAITGASAAGRRATECGRPARFETPRRAGWLTARHSSGDGRRHSIRGCSVARWIVDRSVDSLWTTAHVAVN